jgi:hypothetical protein
MRRSGSPRLWCSSCTTWVQRSGRRGCRGSSGRCCHCRTRIQDPWPGAAQLESPATKVLAEGWRSSPPPSSRRWATGAQPGGQSFSCYREAHSHRSRRLSSTGSSSRHLDSLRRAIYLSKLQGKCFNCLASDHRVAQCRNPTKCLVCPRSGHISYGCPSRRSTSCSSRHRFSPSSNPISPSPSHSLADVTLLDLLLVAMKPPPIQLSEHAEDPMRLEAELA